MIPLTNPGRTEVVENYPDISIYKCIIMYHVTPLKAPDEKYDCTATPAIPKKDQIRNLKATPLNLKPSSISGC